MKHRFAYLLAITLVLGAGAAAAQQSREDCERDFRPRSGQPGKDVIWVPTGDETVSAMLKMAGVTPRDLVVDLGAGDGKIAIAAAKEFGARARGIEYNPDMVKLAQCYAVVEGVADKVDIQQGDIFESDFSDATVVTMYLLPSLNLQLRSTLLDMKPGTRVVSHSFDMDDWEADETYGEGYHQAYLWIVPAKVAGRWDFVQVDGEERFTVELEQSFQKLSGTVALGGTSQPLTQARVRGDEIVLEFTGADGRSHTLTGTVGAAGIEAARDGVKFRATRS
ncbi:MAG: class I SAM-dependent methyltransferase [Proteobacteria bacterium]|nr:MAG: class I SAM-dependent methyltransferase [Pseudomonadota bacterium]